MFVRPWLQFKKTYTCTYLGNGADFVVLCWISAKLKKWTVTTTWKTMTMKNRMNQCAKTSICIETLSFRHWWMINLWTLRSGLAKLKSRTISQTTDDSIKTAYIQQRISNWAKFWLWVVYSRRFDLSAWCVCYVMYLHDCTCTCTSLE